MGMTAIKAKVLNLSDTSLSAELEFLVDSGAMYSVVPRSVLENLGIKPNTTKRFYMVDGTGITREIGNAFFEYGDHVTTAPVVFGEEGDAALMGATTLEGFGLMLDPLRRELRPMLMRL